jgi:hypothetical protein
VDRRRTLEGIPQPKEKLAGAPVRVLLRRAG